MKKILARILILTAIITVLGTAVAFAAPGVYSKHCSDGGNHHNYYSSQYGCEHHGLYYSDSNGDGICDYCGENCNYYGYGYSRRHHGAHHTNHVSGETCNYYDTQYCSR